MQYPTIRISVSPDHRDHLMALLYNTSMQGSQETAEGLLIYFSTEDSPEEVIHILEQHQDQLKLEYHLEHTPYENWNARWEANFQPIRVEDAVGIRAEFHDPMPAVKHEIVIQPRMAFGTGHHATTWMMLKLMQHLPYDKSVVLDYGCGTGILAIMAAMLGSQHVHAVDIEQESYENTLLNAKTNQVSRQITPYHGILTDTPAGPYDIILANINRNVILDSLSALYPRLKAKGFVLLSGLLQEDEDLVHQKALSVGFLREQKLEREGWLALQYRKL